MPDTHTRTWLDEHGQQFTAPATARTCAGRFDSQTHLLFAPFDPWMLQPLTLCGKRAGRIPGADDADCWECLQAREV